MYLKFFNYKLVFKRPAGVFLALQKLLAGSQPTTDRAGAMERKTTPELWPSL